jgi:glucose/arabinose dehydrogenase
MTNSLNVTVRQSQNRNNVIVKPKQTVMVNQAGVVAARRLSDLLDVDVSAKEDGSLLIYDVNQEKFVASRLLDKQEMNGGHF